MTSRLITWALIVTAIVIPWSPQRPERVLAYSAGTIDFCLTKQSVVYTPSAGQPYRVCSVPLGTIPSGDTLPIGDGPNALLVAYRTPTGETLGQAARLGDVAPYVSLHVVFTLYRALPQAQWEQVEAGWIASAYPAAHGASAVFRRRPPEPGPLMAQAIPSPLVAGAYKIVATVRDILGPVLPKQYALATRYFTVAQSANRPSAPAPPWSKVPHLIRLAQGQISMARGVEIAERNDLFFSGTASSSTLYAARDGARWEWYFTTSSPTDVLKGEVDTPTQRCTTTGAGWQCVAQTEANVLVVYVLPDAMNSDSGPWTDDGTTRCGRHMCRVFLQLAAPTAREARDDGIPVSSIRAVTRFLRAVIDPATDRPVEVQGGFLTDLEAHNVSALGTYVFSGWEDRGIRRHFPHVPGLRDPLN